MRAIVIREEDTDVLVVDEKTGKVYKLTKYHPDIVGEEYYLMLSNDTSFEIRMKISEDVE